MGCICSNINGLSRDKSEYVSPDRSMDNAKRIMQEQGYWSNNQQMGLRWSIGCVALEITQRCNLDCTLCYLSELSEAVHDIPLTEIYHRIDTIHRYYGDHTDIQVTGGDPTLRKRDDLIAIIGYIKNKNMRSTLMTNGIRATRSLLVDLANAGLNDVAFHVDTTQNRRGYSNELELNRIRSKYIERTRGLGLSVIFNTTIHTGNFNDIDGLTDFFIIHARDIRTISFQLQADTGRGIAGKRADLITMDTVWKKIEDSVGTAVNYNAIRTGHPLCNRYGMVAVVNNNAWNLFDDEKFTGKIQVATKDIVADRNRPVKTVTQLAAWSLTHPKLFLSIIYWMLSRASLMTRDLVSARGRLTTLSFFVHNFMDACDLDHERLRACVFKNMTREGPVSMCEYNANRDEFILKPVPVKSGKVISFWDPLQGNLVDDRYYGNKKTVCLSSKQEKGRERAG